MGSTRGLGWQGHRMQVPPGSDPSPRRRQADRSSPGTTPPTRKRAGSAPLLGSSYDMRCPCLVLTRRAASATSLVPAARHPGDSDSLPRIARASHHLHVLRPDAQGLGQHLADRLVCLAALGRGCDCDLEVIAQPADDPAAAGSGHGLDLDLDPLGGRDDGTFAAVGILVSLSELAVRT